MTPTIAASATTPPTTPPAIAPVFELELDDEVDVGVAVTDGEPVRDAETALVDDAITEPVDCT